MRELFAAAFNLLQSFNARIKSLPFHFDRLVHPTIHLSLKQPVHHHQPTEFAAACRRQTYRPMSMRMFIEYRPPRMIDIAIATNPFFVNMVLGNNTGNYDVN